MTDPGQYAEELFGEALELPPESRSGASSGRSVAAVIRDLARPPVDGIRGGSPRIHAGEGAL